MKRRLEALERATEKRLDDARDIHRREHDAAEAAHQAVHDTQAAHARELVAMYEHRFANEDRARDLARASMEKRLEAMNEFRDELRSQQGTFMTLAQYTESQKALDQRLNELRDRIINIEKGDVKQEGRSIGQGAVVAIIVTVISVVGTLLGMVIVIANLLTADPPMNGGGM